MLDTTLCGEQVGDDGCHEDKAVLVPCAVHPRWRVGVEQVQNVEDVEDDVEDVEDDVEDVEDDVDDVEDEAVLVPCAPLVGELDGQSFPISLSRRDSLTLIIIIDHD